MTNKNKTNSTRVLNTSIVIKRNLNKNYSKIPKVSLEGKGTTKVNWTGT